MNTIPLYQALLAAAKNNIIRIPEAFATIRKSCNPQEIYNYEYSLSGDHADLKAIAAIKTIFGQDKIKTINRNIA